MTRRLVLAGDTFGIAADNVGMAPDFVRAVSANPELETLHCSNGDLGITLKKR
jgi:hypothetical protein